MSGTKRLVKDMGAFNPHVRYISVYYNHMFIIKKYLSLLILFFLVLPHFDFCYAQHKNRERLECQPVYGDYWKSKRWGWYGAKRIVRTPEEAKEILEKVFINERNVRIGEIRERPRFFEADIINTKGTRIDLIIIDKRSGRIRSVY